jgi:prepilin-type N-terminal cleavage/methylation domain-containing protein/prepilin-type processing-associated H-X9-DG protein
MDGKPGVAARRKVAEDPSLKKRGFTLIELLVVVAIIAILAAILFPVFANARNKAQQTTCQANLSQIAKALQMYSSDFDEKMCPANLALPGWDTNPVIMRMGTWDFLAQSYAQSNGIFRCPSFSTTKPPLMTNVPPAGLTRENWALTYGMNYRLTQYSATTLNDSPTLFGGSISTSEIKRPADTIWIVDNAYVLNSGAMPLHNEEPRLWELRKQDWNWAGYTRFPQDPPGNYDLYRNDPWHPAPIHNEGTDVLFVDGHVKWYRTDQLVNPARATLACLYDNGTP